MLVCFSKRMTYWEERKGGWEIEKPTTTKQKCPCMSTNKNRSETRKGNWNLSISKRKKERKKQWNRERTGNSPKKAKKQETVRSARHSVDVASRSQTRPHISIFFFPTHRTSPWWFYKVCDFDVTGSCDVISPDHFVQGFYYSSFRRCGLNFLVLQKDNKILIHNLSIHEKLEQSTHWNILKKWGKDFTFGSGCTVRHSSHDFGWQFFFFLLKSRLQSHFVAVNCGVFWWWD